jgi:hypothetical protein
MRRLIIVIFSASLSLTCQKFDRFIVIETLPVINYTSTTATLNGNIVDPGEGIKECGHYWWEAGNEASSLKTSYRNIKTGNYTSMLTGLQPGTTYYTKAFATDGGELVFGQVVQFTTQAALLITITTTEVTSITSNAAHSGGNVTSEGGVTITARGVCWSTSQNPTIANDKTTDGTGTGTFTSYLTILLPNTTYYARAYASTSQDVAYGSQVSFTTMQSPVIPNGVDALFIKLPDGMVPIIDGVEDDIWNLMDPVAIEKNFRSETPTVTAYWKAMWNDTAIYVLVSVEDDDHWTSEQSGGNSWDYDKPEIYFDINETLVNGIGPSSVNSGHWQVAPEFKESEEGVETWLTDNSGQCADNYHSFKLYDEGYVFEYRIPFNEMYDKNFHILNVNEIVDKLIGFDVTISDQDEGITTARQRKVWQNDGIVDEAWYNMDDCGVVVFR